jgi:hypothetical protein
MWHIFSSRTKKKHIINFETKLASLLLTELPKVTDTLLLSNVLHISFTSKPEGIYVARSYSPDSFQLINRKYNQHFNLSGITVYHNKSKGYQPLKLFFQSNSLTNIIVDCPKSFHRDFDLNKIQKSSLIIEPVEIINPDQKIAEKALKSLSNEQLTLMDLDGTFEIELGGKFYYTILDMDDGNYIAVTRDGKIYWLNHDSDERAQLLAKNPSDFFLVYKGDKADLQNLLDG